MNAKRPRPRVLGTVFEGRSVSLNLVVGCILAYVRRVESNSEISPIKNQAALSMDMGFSRRLLSKYEAGALNISLSHLAYISSYLNMELYVFQHVLKAFVYDLFKKNIYVFLDTESLPISEDSFDKSTLPNLSYVFIYEWLNLDLELNVSKKTEFKCLDSVSLYELKELILGSFGDDFLNDFRINYRESIVASTIDNLRHSHNEVLYNVERDINHEDGNVLLDKIRKNKSDFRHQLGRIHRSTIDRFNRYNLSVNEKELSYNTVKEIQSPNISIFSNERIHLSTIVDELADVRVAFNKLNNLKAEYHYDISFIFIKNRNEIKLTKINSSEICIVILDNDVDISGFSYLSDFLVYRKKLSETDEDVINLLFESIVKAYYCGKLSPTFLDAEDIKNALSFKNVNFLNVKYYLKSDIQLNGLDGEILTHAKNDGNFLVLLNSKEKLENKEVMRKVWESFNSFIEEINPSYDGEIFYTVALDHEAVEDVFYIGYSLAR